MKTKLQLQGECEPCIFIKFCDEIRDVARYITTKYKFQCPLVKKKEKGEER